MLIDAEQGRESGGLLVGEQVGTGVQASPGTVERVVLTAASPPGLEDPQAGFVMQWGGR